MRTSLSWLEPVLMVALVCGAGCEFFEGDDEAGFETGEPSETDGGEQPPMRGFLVHPKFMLQDVPAIVTIAGEGLAPTSCELDGAGGYLCVADPLAHDSLATITVERDGFEPATRHPEVPFSQILALEVHLAVEGGPTGVWSACAVAGEFASCDELCASAGQGCMVTSCATGQEEWPVASFETFFDGECVELEQSVVAACEDALPVGGGSLRCCCAG